MVTSYDNKGNTVHSSSVSQRSGAHSGTQRQIVRTDNGGLSVSRHQSSHDDDTMSQEYDREQSSIYSVGAQPQSRSK